MSTLNLVLSNQPSKTRAAIFSLCRASGPKSCQGSIETEIFSLGFTISCLFTRFLDSEPLDYFFLNETSIRYFDISLGVVNRAAMLGGELTQQRSM